MVEKNIDPSENQDKIDHFVIEMSLAAGVDISPCIEFWGWPLTEKVQATLQQEGLQPYFFLNDITETVSPTRRDFILQKYPGVNREVSTRSTRKHEKSTLGLTRKINGVNHLQGREIC